MSKNSNFEQKLAKALEELDLPKPIIVADIKNLIWNETGHFELVRLLQLLTENEKSQEKVEKVMNLLQEAWNNFPHKSLEGLSPEEKGKGKNPPKNILKR